MEIIQKKLKDLVPYQFNNKKHPEKQIDLLINSIKDFWFTQPIVVDENNIIIIGHARTEAAKRLWLDTVPVIVKSDLDPVAIKKLRILDNKLSDLAEWDKENLKIELEDIGDQDLTDLFDDLNLDMEDDPYKWGSGILNDKFWVPPFSMLDTRQGYWLERKRTWKDLIQDEGESRQETLFKKMTTGAGKKISAIGTVSILDPVLAEIMIKWFCPKGGKTFDTFAGDTVFGYVSSHLGHSFKGIELRPEQARLNNERTREKGLDAEYICDDGQNVLKHFEENSRDFYFSCPPYFDLEVYSDDPKDASNQGSYAEFLQILDNSFTGAAKVLKNDRFAVVVMSNIRDKNGFYIHIVDDIKRIMQKNGLRLYNDIILINSFWSAGLRANNAMRNRKVVKTHQNVMVFYKWSDLLELESEFADTRETIKFHEDILVFYKGDPKNIQATFWEVEMEDMEAMIEAEAVDDEDIMPANENL